MQLSHIVPLNEGYNSLALPIFTSEGKFYTQEGGDEFNAEIEFREIDFPETAIKYSGALPETLGEKVCAFIYEGQHYSGSISSMSNLAKKLMSMFGDDILLQSICISSNNGFLDHSYFQKVLKASPCRLTDRAIKLYMQSVAQVRGWEIILSKIETSSIEQLRSRLGAQVFYLDERSELQFKSYDSFLDPNSDIVANAIVKIKIDLPWLENFTRPALESTVSLEAVEEKNENEVLALVEKIDLLTSMFARQEERIAALIFCFYSTGISTSYSANISARAQSERAAYKCLSRLNISIKDHSVETFVTKCYVEVMRNWRTGEKWMLSLYLGKWFINDVRENGRIKFFGKNQVPERIVERMYAIKDGGDLGELIQTTIESLDQEDYFIRKSAREIERYFDTQIFYTL